MPTRTRIAAAFCVLTVLVVAGSVQAQFAAPTCVPPNCNPAVIQNIPLSGTAQTAAINITGSGKLGGTFQTGASAPVMTLVTDNLLYGNVGGTSTNGSLLLLQFGTADRLRVTLAGQQQLPTGSVGAPAYSFIGDTNSGLYSSAADTLHLVTNGANRVSVDSAGAVLIPGALTVNGAFAAGGGITAGGGVNVCLQNGTNCPATLGGSGTANYVTKFTGTGSTVGNSQVFDNGTNVGIGTASPSNLLDVNTNGASGYMSMSVTGGADLGYKIQESGSSKAQFTANTGNGQVVVGAMAAPYFLSLYSAGSEAVRVSTSGNVGIGTASPGAKLQVEGGNSELWVGNGGAREQLTVLGNTMRLNYGNVMIAKNLGGVAGTDSYRTMGTNGGVGYAGIEFRYAGDTMIYGANGATTQDAVVTPSARLYVQGSTGNVGIGTLSPGAKLDVAGTARFTGVIGANGYAPTAGWGITTGGTSYGGVFYGGSYGIWATGTVYALYAEGSAYVNGNIVASGNITRGGVNVCLQNGTNCPASAGVTSVTGSGAGISVSPTTGAVVVSNTGVTSNVAGAGISLSGGTGAVTITNTGVLAESDTLQTVTSRSNTTTTAISVAGLSSIGGTSGVYGSGSTNGVWGAGGIAGVRGDGSSFGGYFIGSDRGIYASGPNFGVYGAGGTYGVYGNGTYGGYFSGTTGLYATGATWSIDASGPARITGTLAVSGTVTQAGVNVCLQNGTNCPASGGVTGSGTANYVAKFTGATTVGNSQIVDNGSNVSIAGPLGTNGASPTAGRGISAVGTDRGGSFQGDNTGIYGVGGMYGVYGNSSNFGVYGNSSSGGYGVYGAGGSYGVRGDGTIQGVVAMGGTTGLYASGSTYAIDAGGTVNITGRLRFNNSTTADIYESGGRINVRSDGTDGVVQFASYGMYIPSTGTNIYLGQTMYMGYNAALGVSGSGWLCLSSGTTGTVQACGSSSIRYKKDVNDLVLGLDAVKALRPVTYRLKESNQPGFGFIAEEVEQIDPMLVYYNQDGQVEGVQYPYMAALMAKAIQELDVKVEGNELKISARLDDHETRIKRLEAEVSAMKAELGAMRAR